MKTVIDWARYDYRAGSVEELIEIFLKDLGDKTIREQLRSRGIREVHFLDCRGASLSPKPYGAFCLFLGGYPRDWPMDIGHELAHTFFWRQPLEKNRWPERKYVQHSREEEDFCEEFSRAWCRRARNRAKSYSYARRLFSAWRKGARVINS